VNKKVLYLGSGNMNKLEIIKNKETRKKIRYLYYISIIFLSIFSLTTIVNVKEDKEYADFDHLVLYIYEYNDLPSNYIPKSQSFLIEGEDLYIYDSFSNREALLPLGNQYTEVYINATKDDPGIERLVYTTGVIYYTNDHYKSFNEVTKADIKAPHIFITVLLVIDIIGGVTFTIIIKKYEILTLNEIKDDLRNDYLTGKKTVLKITKDIKQKFSNKVEKRK